MLILQLLKPLLGLILASRYNKTSIAFSVYIITMICVIKILDWWLFDVAEPVKRVVSKYISQPYNLIMRKDCIPIAIVGNVAIAVLQTLLGLIPVRRDQ